MKVPAHPVSEVGAAFYHGCIAAFLAMGLLFHAGAAAYAVHLYRMADMRMVWALATLAFYHGIVAGFLVIGLAFHVYACSRHWYDRFADKEQFWQPRDYPQHSEACVEYKDRCARFGGQMASCVPGCPMGKQ